MKIRQHPRMRDISIGDGRLTAAGDASRDETYAALLARHGGQPVEVTIASRPGAETQQYSMHSFGAVFSAGSNAAGATAAGPLVPASSTATLTGLSAPSTIRP